MKKYERPKDMKKYIMFHINLGKHESFRLQQEKV